MTIPGFARPLAAAVALLAAGCSSETTVFDAGVEPLEVPAAAPAEWPAMPTTPGALALLTGSRMGSPEKPAHSWAHGRALLPASIAQVWSALQWRTGVLLAVYPDTPTVECTPIERPEPGYELSYGVKEIPRGGALYQQNWFQVNWRAATTRDAAQAIQKVNVRAQKVDGTTWISLLQESIVATPAPGGGTQLEIVRHINAPDESPASAGEWIELWVAALQAELAGAPLLPSSYCFP